jgi:hypothetical protein
VRGRWRAIVLVDLVVLSVGLLQTSPGHALLRDTGLFEVPTSYTELAFTTPAGLPDQLASEHASIEVSFGIHNVSASARTYRWSIALVRSDKSQVKASGVVNAPAHGHATVGRTVATVCAGGRLQVVVRLASPAESIDFWATCLGHTRSVH